MEKKILIIDDEDIVLKSCMRILRNDNYRIDTAYSGEEGLSRIDQEKYDLVITDLMMPGMSGMDVLRNVKERKLDLIVVIFTGYATSRNRPGSSKNGRLRLYTETFYPGRIPGCSTECHQIRRRK
jgi:DNA-binding NtrC family response regulator